MIIALCCFLGKDSDYVIPLFPGVLFGFAFAFALVFSTTTNATDNAAKIRNEIQYKMSDFEDRRNKLTVINADIEKVKAYNQEVKQFREEIREKQENLSNPWINYFTCYVYNDFDVKDIKFINYTIRS